MNSSSAKKIIVLATLLAVAATATWTLTKQFKNHVYVKPMSDPIETLDPSKTRARQDFMIARTIFGQLLELNEFGDVEPALIESWNISSDGRIVQLHPRAGVQFHSGKIATADDVMFSIHFLARHDSLTSMFFDGIEGYEEFISGSSDHLSGVRVLDAKTIEIRLKHPSFIFLSTLADPKIVVLPRDLNGLPEDQFFSHPDGIGPYRFGSLSPNHTELLLIRNDSYFKRMPAIASYRLITLSKEIAIQRFLDGQVHDLEGFYISNDESRDLAAHGRVLSMSSYSTQFIFVNGRRKPFQNIEIRRLLRASINANLLRDHCGVPILESTGVIPHGGMGWINPQEQMSQNYSEAERKHAQATLAQHGSTLRLLVYGDESSPCILNDITKQLTESLGVRVQIVRTELAKATAIFIKGDYDLFWENISVRGREPFHLFSYFDSGSPHNLTGFLDPEIAKRLQAINATPLRHVRAELYHSLNKYISTDNIYAVPVYSDLRHYIFSPSVHGPGVPATIFGNIGMDRIEL
jgi:ABC-type transport system substrate-binding protein